MRELHKGGIGKRTIQRFETYRRHLQGGRPVQRADQGWQRAGVPASPLQPLAGLLNRFAITGLGQPVAHGLAGGSGGRIGFSGGALIPVIQQCF
jgi:hypothetical protein